MPLPTDQCTQLFEFTDAPAEWNSTCRKDSLVLFRVVWCLRRRHFSFFERFTVLVWPQFQVLSFSLVIHLANNTLFNSFMNDTVSSVLLASITSTVELSSDLRDFLESQNITHTYACVSSICILFRFYVCLTSRSTPVIF